MGLFGSIAGGLLGIGGAIAGGVSASKAMKKVKRNIEGQMKDNQNWFDRKYHENTTQRADTQHILNMTEENFRQRNRAAAGTQAVMGGTTESVAAEKEANNRALADATSRIAVAGEARKDNIEAQYQARKADLNRQLNDLEQQKAQNVTQAANGVADAAGSLFGIL